MKRILMSINPQHVEKILNGSKKYEYRRVRCREDVSSIVVYATYPVSKVVAEVDVLKIVEDTPEGIWAQTQKESGISEEFFFGYFRNRKKAIAYVLGEIHRYEPSLDIVQFGLTYVPQSFVYLP